MPRTINIAAIQMAAQPAPVPQRLERAEKLVTQAAGQGAQLAVLPELFNSGYEYSDQNYVLAERMEGQTATWMKESAARHQLYLAGSFLLLDEEDIYNTLLLVAPDGRAWRYDKNYPWMWERAYFRPGHAITIADTPLGKLGLMICMDQGRAELWARYAGKVDAMVISSCPPTMQDLTLIFPDGKRVKSKDLNPLQRQIYLAGGEIFGRYLRRQSAWLGVPVVNTTGTGHFSSGIPLPHLSLAMYGVTRPDLWPYLPRAGAARIETAYFNETYVADASGRVLAQVPPETEHYALAQVTLAEALPRPRTAQPDFGLPASVYQFDDFANSVLAPVYRRQARRVHGPQMAPVSHQTRLWLGAVTVAGLAGYLLGKTIGRKKKFL